MCFPSSITSQASFRTYTSSLQVYKHQSTTPKSVEIISQSSNIFLNLFLPSQMGVFSAFWVLQILNICHSWPVVIIEYPLLRRSFLAMHFSARVACAAAMPATGLSQCQQKRTGTKCLLFSQTIQSTTPQKGLSSFSLNQQLRLMEYSILLFNFQLVYKPCTTPYSVSIAYTIFLRSFDVILSFRLRYLKYLASSQVKGKFCNLGVQQILEERQFVRLLGSSSYLSELKEPGTLLYIIFMYFHIGQVDLLLQL